MYTDFKELHKAYGFENGNRTRDKFFVFGLWVKSW